MKSTKITVFKRRFFIFIRNPLSRLLLNLLLFSFLICALALSVLLKAQPVLDEIAMSRVKYIAVSAVNSAVSGQINNNYDIYSDIIFTEKDKDNKITAVKTNIAKTNLIKTGVTAAVLSEMSKLENSEIAVPVGNLTNIDFLSGTGPKIKIKLLPTNTVSTKLISSFASCGINQTKHQIILQMQVDLSIIFPQRIKSAQVLSDVIIAETILAGNVPESYTYIDDTRESLTSKVNDYSNKTKTAE